MASRSQAHVLTVRGTQFPLEECGWEAVQQQGQSRGLGVALIWVSPMWLWAMYLINLPGLSFPSVKWS